MAQREIAILFARKDSIYKSMPDCDVWDAERNALNWQGGCPVVAHPPCRLWGSLSGLSTAPRKERRLATWSVNKVRKYGGVVEHPAYSKLWKVMKLPLPGQGYDKYGGWTMSAPQQWWGHKAEKMTWFYIVGTPPTNLPTIPYVMGEAEYVIATSRRKRHRPEVSKSEREHTPLLLAEWLCEVARKSNV